VRITQGDILRLHEADLTKRFAHEGQNLDIVELAALYAAVPESFPQTKKENWRLSLEQSLRVMRQQQLNNALPASKQRHPAYRGASALYSERVSLYEMNAVSGADVGKPRDSFRHIRAVTFSDSNNNNNNNNNSSSSSDSRRSVHFKSPTAPRLDHDTDRAINETGAGVEARTKAEAEISTSTATTRASMTISNDAVVRVRSSTSSGQTQTQSQIQGKGKDGRSRSLKGSVFSEELNSLFSSPRRPSGKPSNPQNDK
jgi:hypothetical protein